MPLSEKNSGGDSADCAEISARFFCALRNPVFVGFFLFVLLVSASVASLSFGTSTVGFDDVAKILSGVSVDDTAETIFFKIRLPRLSVALIAGISLSLAGAAMQAIFRNPLADPSVLGVSSGAALGAVSAMGIAGGGTAGAIFGTQFGAIFFGLAATLFVCALGRGGKIISSLLGGMAVNAFCGAIVGFMLYTSHETGLKSYIFWALGSLDNADVFSISTAAAISVPTWIIVVLCARKFNAVAVGWRQAFNMGVNTNALWFCAVGATALMTASAVSIGGIIGFVGLVVPHIIRLWTGADNRSLLPLSALAGALLLVLADIISRAANPADPVPIGVITSLVGVPFFLFLLKFGGKKNA